MASASLGRLGREKLELRLRTCMEPPSSDSSCQGLPSSLICRQKDMSNALDVTPHLPRGRAVLLLQQSHNRPLESRVAAGMQSHSHVIPLGINDTLALARKKYRAESKFPALDFW